MAEAPNAPATVKFRTPLLSDDAGLLLLFVEELEVVRNLMTPDSPAARALGPAAASEIGRLCQVLGTCIAQALDRHGLKVQKLPPRELICRTLDDLAAQVAHASMRLRHEWKEAATDATGTRS